MPGIFTTRPEIRGTFGVVTSTHWIASATGFGVLDRGGNAFDAAVATGLVLQVVEPQLNGPAGDLPAIFRVADQDDPQVLCAQGVAPRAATIGHFRALGLGMVPGSGLLATVVPGAFDGWMLLLRDHGTISLRAAMQPAIDYARNGHPLLAAVSESIAGLAEMFARDWPSSAAVWMPEGRAPEPGALFRNPDLARTYERLVAEGEAVGADRGAQIDAARRAWREGFVAEAIFDYLDTAEVMDVSGTPHRAVLSRGDMAGWEASYEPTLSLDYHGWRVHKTGPWGQGPVLLQALALLRGFDLGAMDPHGAEFVHTVIEAIKLAFADREAYYGDSGEVPVKTLLSEDYAAGRRALIGPEASHEQRPGRIPGYEHLAEACIERGSQDMRVPLGAGVGEPTMGHLDAKSEGDTVHLDIIDRWGNTISATPSGGWLSSSPVIPGLGFPLNNRAQMFWLDEGLPSSLKPGRRPRTSLTPTLAEKDGAWLAFGTPGGDKQDQWQLVWFLRYVHHGLAPQAAIDAPLFHSTHFQASFYPRAADPGAMMIEPSISEDVIAELRRRGHRVTVSEAWALGRLTAARRDADGLLHAAATPRLMQAYAIGR